MASLKHQTEPSWQQIENINDIEQKKVEDQDHS